MAHLFLVVAIVCEVIATTFLRFTSGERAMWWVYPIAETLTAAQLLGVALVVGGVVLLELGGSH